MRRLENKIAVVTGASRGIGAAIALRLAREGAQVGITYPDESHAPLDVLRTIRDAGGVAWGLEADSTDAAAVEAAIDRTAAQRGRIDILVNNAGIVVAAPIQELSVDDYDRIAAVNVRGTFVATRAAVRHMPDDGRIIMIGSCNADRMPLVGGSLYALTKAAIAGFTKGLARDLGSRRITVNNIQPGPTDTPLNPADGPSADATSQITALGRFAHVDEIAGLVAYLASEEAAFVTGASLNIDGGFNS